MTSDERYAFFESMEKTVLSSIPVVFGDDVEVTKTDRNYKHMGWFRIYAHYKPTGMLLEFENDTVERIGIRISDNDGAATCLGSIEPYDNISCTVHNGRYVLEHDNILNALKLLQTVLLRNDFPLFFSKGNKYYMKLNGEIKRIRK